MPCVVGLGTSQAEQDNWPASAWTAANKTNRRMWPEHSRPLFQVSARAEPLTLGKDKRFIRRNEIWSYPSLF